MAQTTESLSAVTPSNIQDAFLNHARREHLAVTIHLMDGRQFDARIKSFDRFVVMIDVDDCDRLVFKHAIATIATAISVADYSLSPRL
jgi:host factor-I protein